MTRLRARWWMWRYILLRPELVVVLAIGAALQGKAWLVRGAEERWA